MKAPNELSIIIDSLALFASLLSVGISTTTSASDLNITKVFRPIFISYSLFSLCVTSLYICDDVIRDVHSGYGGNGYIRLAVFGSNSLMVILHQVCLTYAEILTIRSMTGKKSLVHGKSLLLVVWVLGLSLFGCLLAFAKMKLVAVVVSVIMVLVSFASFLLYYICKLRVYRNNRLYVEHIRCKDIKQNFKTRHEKGSTSLVHQPWNDIFIPRILLVAYYVTVLPFIIDLIVHLMADGSKTFSIDESSRSIFLVINDLYFVFFGGLVLYLKFTSFIQSLPKLR